MIKFLKLRPWIPQGHLLLDPEMNESDDCWDFDDEDVIFGHGNSRVRMCFIQDFDGSVIPVSRHRPGDLVQFVPVTLPSPGSLFSMIVAVEVEYFTKKRYLTIMVDYL